MQWIRFVDAYDASLPSWRLGNPQVFHSTPEFHALIGVDRQPQCVLHLYTNAGAFKDAVIWQSWAVIGMGDEVYWFNPLSHHQQSFSLEGYFGHLYALEDVLLVASASALWCFDAQGKVRWHTDGLGLDGVLVHNVQGSIIEGEGEWDPPGGWQPFYLELNSGEQT